MRRILLKYMFVVLVVFSCVPKAHANFEALQEILAGKDEYDMSIFYAEYLKNEDASPEDIDTILGVVAGFGGWQYRVYDAYMHRKNPDPNVIRQIIMTARQFENIDTKASVYDEYFGAPITLNPDLVTMIIEDSIDFMKVEYEIPEVYKRYLEREEVDVNAVKRILDIAATENYTPSNQVTLYKAYVRRPDAAKEIILQILIHIQGFEEEEKLEVYQAYIQRQDIDPGIVAEIFYQASLFQDRDLGLYVFKSASQRNNPDSGGTIREKFYQSIKKVDDLVAYIKQADADINLIEEKMQDVGAFQDYYKKRIFKAYFESPHTSENQVNKIVQDLLNSSSSSAYWVFKTYLMGKYANKEFIEATLLSTENFNDYGKALFYSAYLIAKDIYQNNPGLFKSDVFDTITDPIHLRAPLQDDEIRTDFKERVIKGFLIELDILDASVLWKILGTFAQGSFTKSAVH